MEDKFVSFVKTDCVEYLKRYEENIFDYKDILLIKACSMSCHQSIKYFLSLGANPNAFDGKSIREAVFRGDIDGLCLLMQKDGILFNELFSLAIYGGRYDMMRFLFDHGCYEQINWIPRDERVRKFLFNNGWFNKNMNPEEHVSDFRLGKISRVPGRYERIVSYLDSRGTRMLRHPEDIVFEFSGDEN